MSALQPEQTDFPAVRTPRTRRSGQSAEVRWGRGGSPIATTMRRGGANATPGASFSHICTANASAAARERRRSRRPGHRHGCQPAAARPYAPAICPAAGPCRGGGALAWLTHDSSDGGDCTANASAAACERRRSRRRGHRHGWQPAAARPYAPSIGLAARPCRGGGRLHGSHTTLATAVIARPVRDGSEDGGGGDRGGAGDPAVDAGEARTPQRRVQASSTARLKASVGPELALSAAIDHADSGLATGEMKSPKI